jgi:hypothetical protein
LRPPHSENRESGRAAPAVTAAPGPGGLILASVVSLLVGAAFGRLAMPMPPTVDLDLAAEAGLLDLDHPHDTCCRLQPYRVVRDGVARDVPGAEKHGEKWALFLGDGRVTIYAVRRTE